MPTQHYRPETYLARNSIGYLLKRAHSQLADQLEPALEARGFTFTQWVVLMHLRDGLALNARVLCTQLRHDSGALTRVIDQLEARDLVRRERSRRDRREVQLQLTAAGQATVEAAIPAVVERLNHALGGFSASELEALTRLLTKLTGMLEGLGANQGAGAHDGDAAEQSQVVPAAGSRS
ncbi:MAG TPA: MarR family winged helix-turn-helix transcriptional regulator [Steroidobacteraceae bacterium]|nr:MarR family winged helix-turn-helix transcriptional regulator [Steroidobacteraceae bacterium]